MAGSWAARLTGPLGYAQDVTVLVYLRFSLVENTDLDDFRGDLWAMAELAEDQPGHHWSEIGQSIQDPSVFVIASEWNTLDDVRAWEHEDRHVEIQHKWEPQFREPLLHQRFTPWERPPSP
jgi:heme-degrading monooxygenase HmoA